MALAMYHRQMSPLASRVVYEPRVRFQSRRIALAPRAELPFGVRDVLTAHRLGISHSTAKRTSSVLETTVKLRPEEPGLAAAWAAGAAAETPVRCLRGVSRTDAP